ncbi:protein CFAP20DC-like isoform X2 [Tubulanus polymorphus]|uniref:protein CFAP20DC-like isoform X2 n=1 Tax=Tubulanus polymorphus TaxID=672921 RepID=UPI003DA25182
MFKNEYQGGPYFDVFSVQGKDPLANWKQTGSSSIRKVYDKEVKSYIYNLEGHGATTKIQLPKDSRQSLMLIQRFLVFQVFIPKGQDFAIEIGLKDMGNNKRRLVFSTALKETVTTPLHAKVPLTYIKRSMWMNLCLDMVSFIGGTWKLQTFKAIESLTVCANCRIRRIFTMKVQPMDTTSDDVATLNSSSDLDVIPKQCQLPTELNHVTQVLNVNLIKLCDSRGKGDITQRPLSATLTESDSSSRKNSTLDGFRIAFGSKVPAPVPSAPTHRKHNSKEGIPTGRLSGRVLQQSNSAGKSRTDDSTPFGSVSYRGSSAENSRLLEAELLEHQTDNLHESEPRTSVSISTGHRRMLSDPGGQLDLTQEEKIWSVSSEATVVPHPPSFQPDDKLRRRHRIKSRDKLNKAGGDSEDETAVTEAMETLRRQADTIYSQEEFQIKSNDSFESKLNDSFAQDYEDSDEEANKLESMQQQPKIYDADIYMYHSVPKLVRMKTSTTADEIKQIAHSKCQQSARDLNSSRGPRLDDDFHDNDSDDSNDYDLLNVKQSTRLTPSPKGSRNKSPIGLSLNRKTPSPTPGQLSPHQVTILNNNNIPMEVPPGGASKDKSKRLKKSSYSVKVLLSPESRLSGSQLRQSISKKSLREIPKSDARLSQLSNRQYDFTKYQMGELTESFEAGMMASMKRQTEEEASNESPMSLSEQRFRHRKTSPDKQTTAHLDYTDLGGSSTDEEDTTSYSTWRTHPQNLAVHHYQDEMNIHASRTSSDTLGSSNPRDWSGVFSPPIILPGDVKKSQDNVCSSTEQSLQKNLQSTVVQDQLSQDATVDQQTELLTDEEEELDLLYDPCLNCYFDPKSCKYYELV